MRGRREKRRVNGRQVPEFISRGQIKKFPFSDLVLCKILPTQNPDYRSSFSMPYSPNIVEYYGDSTKIHNEIKGAMIYNKTKKTVFLKRC